MFDQQVDIFGDAHDIAPDHEVMHLFNTAPQIRGQLALDTDDPETDPWPFETNPREKK